MNITQTIPLNILNKCFIIENFDNILFIYFDINGQKIKIEPFDKSKFGNQQFIFEKTIN